MYLHTVASGGSVIGNQSAVHGKAALVNANAATAAVRTGNPVVSDLALVHDKLSAVLHPDATTAATAAVRCGVARDFAALHGERSRITHITITYSHAAAVILRSVAADFAAGHMKRTIVHIHTSAILAGVARNNAAIHSERTVSFHIDAGILASGDLTGHLLPIFIHAAAVLKGQFTAVHPNRGTCTLFRIINFPAGQVQRNIFVAADGDAVFAASIDNVLLQRDLAIIKRERVPLVCAVNGIVEVAEARCKRRQNQTGAQRHGGEHGKAALTKHLKHFHFLFLSLHCSDAKRSGSRAAIDTAKFVPRGTNSGGLPLNHCPLGPIALRPTVSRGLPCNRTSVGTDHSAPTPLALRPIVSNGLPKSQPGQRSIGKVSAAVVP